MLDDDVSILASKILSLKKPEEIAELQQSLREALGDDGSENERIGATLIPTQPILNAKEK